MAKKTEQTESHLQVATHYYIIRVILRGTFSLPLLRFSYPAIVVLVSCACYLRLDLNL